MIHSQVWKHPPPWLVNTIGGEPPHIKHAGGITLAWRRAALAIYDFRELHGFGASVDALGPTPLDPAVRRAHRRAERAIAEVSSERERRKLGRSH